MSTQGTVRLKILNGSPSVDKLWNNRYRLEFLCDNNSPKEDWYYDNIASILPDYGVLQDADFGSGVSESWEAIPGSVYPDMRLIETQYTYISSIGDKRVRLTYETLTSNWVEQKQEDVDYKMNGLKRIVRTLVAMPETEYTNIVGETTIISDGTTLYLGSYKISKTDAKWELLETWLEAGIVSRANVDSENGSEIQRVTTYLAVEDNPTGIVTRRDVRSIEGLSTYTITEILSSDGSPVDPTGANPISQKIGLSEFSIPGLVRLRNSASKYIAPTSDPSIAVTVAVTNYSFDLVPPVGALSKTIEYEFIQTNPDIVSGDYTYDSSRGLWAPGGWARTRVSGVDIDNKPFSVSKAYRGYRCPENLINFTTPYSEQPTGARYGYPYNGWRTYINRLTGPDGIITGKLYIDGYQMSTSVPPMIEMSGGPEDPSGRKYVTSVKIFPYVNDIDGVKYYKKFITVVEVNGETIDDDLNESTENNKLAVYEATQVPNKGWSFKLDDSLSAFDEGFYANSIIEVYSRQISPENKFLTLQSFKVYDYDALNNTVLVDKDFDPEFAVGRYNSGSISTPESYEKANIRIVKYDQTITYTAGRYYDNVDYIFYYTGSLFPVDGAVVYSGWKVQALSGEFQGVLFPILKKHSSFLRIDRTGNVGNLFEPGTEFKIIPPATF